MWSLICATRVERREESVILIETMVTTPVMGRGAWRQAVQASQGDTGAVI
jgi:hypothetical protein